MHSTPAGYFRGSLNSYYFSTQGIAVVTDGQVSAYTSYPGGVEGYVSMRRNYIYGKKLNTVRNKITFQLYLNFKLPLTNCAFKESFR